MEERSFIVTRVRSIYRHQIAKFAPIALLDLAVACIVEQKLVILLIAVSINKVVDLANEGIFSGIHYSLYLKPLSFQRLTHCFYIFSDAT